MEKIRVTVWNENIHEKSAPAVAKLYPNGMHNSIKDVFDADGRFETKTATLDMDECGLTDEVLKNTDVLFWWGHAGHHLVPDEIVEKVYNRVLQGMGLVLLHSGHFSKIFQKLMGTSCNLRWRESGDKERLWVIDPSHPIAKGLPPYFEISEEETYGEHFDIPEPEETVFVSWFTGGEVFRSGITYRRRNGKIFYFRPGHETFPTYYDENVKKVLVNAALWAADTHGPALTYGFFDAVEKK